MLENVNDPVFAMKTMGDGVGIIPSEGRVYAPFDGKAAVVFPTGHALGLVDEDGLEVLIHIGIDTVQLNGKGFRAHIQQGDKVKKGDLLVEFDRELIEEEGYDTTVMYIITNMDDVKELTTKAGGKTEAAGTVMQVTK